MTLKVAEVPSQTVVLRGCVVITGNWASTTVTVNEQVEELPQTSVAVDVTVVTPIGKAVPEEGALIMFTDPAQLSVAVTV